MRSKDIIGRVERPGGPVVVKAGKGSHTKIACRCGTYKTTVPKSDNVHPKTCKSIETALGPCLGEGWLRGGADGR